MNRVKLIETMDKVKSFLEEIPHDEVDLLICVKVLEERIQFLEGQLSHRDRMLEQVMTRLFKELDSKTEREEG